MPQIDRAACSSIRPPPARGTWRSMRPCWNRRRTAASATLRFYEWKPATLSLGYFQAAADREQHAASRDCPLVRRASGGGAILHDRELTYSIALPQAQGRLCRGELESVTTLVDDTSLIRRRWLNSSRSLQLFARPMSAGHAVRQNAAAPFLCFQRRSCGDIVVQSAKIVGSAQRRRRGAVLQHGSILLARSPFAPELPGIQELTGAAFRLRRRAAWTPRLAARLRLRLPGRDFGRQRSYEPPGAAPRPIRALWTRFASRRLHTAEVTACVRQSAVMRQPEFAKSSGCNWRCSVGDNGDVSTARLACSTLRPELMSAYLISSPARVRG